MSPIRNVPGAGGVGRPNAPQQGASAGPKFADILKSKLDGVRWSAHAAERIAARGITLTDADRNRIDAALQLARQKGSRNSLFLLKDVGLVVSVANRTVVTAIDKADLKERVFTDIDSTVILD